MTRHSILWLYSYRNGLATIFPADTELPRHLVNAVFVYLYVFLRRLKVSPRPLYSNNPPHWTYPSYFWLTTVPYSDLSLSHLQRIFPSSSMLAQRRRSIPDASLSTQSSYCYRRPPSIVPALDGIPLANTQLLKILAHTHVVGLRRRGRSVGGCSLNDNR